MSLFSSIGKNRECDSVRTKAHRSRRDAVGCEVPLAEETPNKGEGRVQKEGVFCCQWCNLKYLFYEQCKWTMAVEGDIPVPFVLNVRCQFCCHANGDCKYWRRETKQHFDYVKILSGNVCFNAYSTSQSFFIRRYTYIFIPKIFIKNIIRLFKFNHVSTWCLSFNSLCSFEIFKKQQRTSTKSQSLSLWARFALISF